MLIYLLLVIVVLFTVYRFKLAAINGNGGFTLTARLRLKNEHTNETMTAAAVYAAF
ncbi:MAG: hypothetical protein IPL84_00250 [Chitinophagaceae bacterium]|nr:hypothetical protein [Chitinophagaceae bacterium]